MHHYKKHKKRRSKDPTKFRVVVNAGGEIKHYEGALSAGDPIQLVCEVNLEAPEERGTDEQIEQALIAQETEKIAEEERLAIEMEEQRQAELAEAEEEVSLRMHLVPNPRQWHQGCKDAVDRR